MLDAVVRGIFTPPAEVAFTTTNIIIAVNCVLQLHHSDFFGSKFLGRNSACPLDCIQRCRDISLNLCVIIFGHYIIFAQAELY